LKTYGIEPAPEHKRRGRRSVREEGKGADASFSGCDSEGREAHVCPFGRVEMMVSNDEGRFGFGMVGC
jgi:hypothetical protein